MHRGASALRVTALSSMRAPSAIRSASVVGDIGQSADGLLERQAVREHARDRPIGPKCQAAARVAKHVRHVLGPGGAQVAQEPAVGLQRGAGSGRLEDVLGR